MNQKAKKKRDHVVTRISKLRKAIRKKYKQFKRGEIRHDMDLAKQYKPFISELKKIEPGVKQNIKTEQTNKAEDGVKKEAENGDDDFEGFYGNFQPQIYSSPGENKTVIQPYHQDEEEVDMDSDEDLSSVLSTTEGRETASHYIDENFDHPYTKKYMKLMMGGREKGKRDVIDHTFGPRFDGEALKIGNSFLKFEEDGRIRIDDITYKGTEGLYELIFKRLPDEDLYDDEDLRAYRDILLKTNAYKKNYLPSGNVNRNNSLKYKHVISQLFPYSQQRKENPYSGKGLMTKTLSAPDRSYWDDPNELVDRLRLLVASAEAGNTGVKNEIINIVEELREAHLILGQGNATFKALLK